MIIAEGGGSAYSSPPSVSISIPQQFPRRVLREEEVNRDLALEEMIALARNQALPQSRYGRTDSGSASAKAYLDNLLWIQAHPPVKKEAKGEQQTDLDRILDAIFYASAIASIIPIPPLSIGGRIGMLASSAGRAYQSGNSWAAARYISQMSRTADRGIRQYRAYNKRYGSGK